MENQLFFYDLFISVLGIVLFLYYLYKIITTIKGSYKSVSNRSDIVAFIKKADKVVIDLLEVTFRSQVNQKESFDFTFFENEIIPETEKPNIYIEYKNRGVVSFKYRDKEYHQLIRADNIPEKSVLIHFYKQRQTYLYIDKTDVSKRYLDLFFLEKATNRAFIANGVEEINLDTYDLEIKYRIYG